MLDEGGMRLVVIAITSIVSNILKSIANLAIAVTNAILPSALKYKTVLQTDTPSPQIATQIELDPPAEMSFPEEDTFDTSYAETAAPAGSPALDHLQESIQSELATLPSLEEEILSSQPNLFAISPNATPQIAFEILLKVTKHQYLGLSSSAILNPAKIAIEQLISNKLKDDQWLRQAQKALNIYTKPTLGSFQESAVSLFKKELVKQYISDVVKPPSITFHADHEVSFSSNNPKLINQLTQLGIKHTVSGGTLYKCNVEDCFRVISNFRKQELFIQKFFDESYYHINKEGKKVCWGFQIKPSSFGEYQVSIQTGYDKYLPGVYSIWTLMRTGEESLPEKDRKWKKILFDAFMFPPLHEISPKISGDLLGKIYHILKKNRDCRDGLTETLDTVFGSDVIKISEGRKPLTDLFQNGKAGLTDEKFLETNGFSTDILSILQDPQAQGGVVLLNAIQMKTYSTIAMLQTESCFSDLNILAYNGSPKQYLDGTRDPGKLHCANLQIIPTDQSALLCDSLKAFQHILEITEFQPASWTETTTSIGDYKTNFLVKRNEMLVKYKEIIKKDLLETFKPFNIKVSSEEFAPLNKAATRKEIELAREQIFRQVLNRAMILGESVWVCSVPEISQTKILAALYPSATPPIGEALMGPQMKTRFDLSFAAFENSKFYKEAIQRNDDSSKAFLVGYKGFKDQVPEAIKNMNNAGLSSVYYGTQQMMPALIYWEKFLYLLSHSPVGSLSENKQSIEIFFASKNGTYWKACNQGLSSDMQTLLTILAKNSGEDPLLSHKTKLVDQFWLDILPTLGTGELKVDEADFKAAASTAMGLDITEYKKFKHLGDATTRAKKCKELMTQYFSPYDVFISYYQLFKDAIEKIEADRDLSPNACFKEKIPEFVTGTSPLIDIDAYIDPIMGTFDCYKLYQDFPNILLGYLVKKGYLKQGNRNDKVSAVPITAFFTDLQKKAPSKKAMYIEKLKQLTETFKRGYSLTGDRKPPATWPATSKTLWEENQRHLPWSAFSTSLLPQTK